MVRIYSKDSPAIHIVCGACEIKWKKRAEWDTCRCQVHMVSSGIEAAAYSEQHRQNLGAKVQTRKREIKVERTLPSIQIGTGGTQTTNTEWATRRQREDPG